MPQLRIARVLCLSACLASTPWPHEVSRVAPVEPAPMPVDREAANVIAPAPSGPQPFGLLARFGETRLRHPAPVWSVVFSPDGRTLATTTETEPFVRLWDATTGRLSREVPVQKANGNTLTLAGMSADACFLLLVRDSHNDDREREWGVLDARSGDFRVVGKLLEEVEPPIVSPDGIMIGGVSEKGELTIWSFDPATPSRSLRSVHNGPLHGPNRVAFSPDSRQIVAGCGKALLAAPTSGSGSGWEIDAPRYRSYHGVFWPRPDQVVTTSERSATTFDPATGRILANTDNGWHSKRAIVVIAGGMLLSRDDYKGGMVVINPGTLKSVETPRFRAFPYGSSFTASADGKVLAAAVGCAVHLFNATTGESLFPDVNDAPADPANRFYFSTDGKRMLSVGGSMVQTWEMPQGRLLVSAPIIAEGDSWRSACITLSADGRWVITSSTYDMKTVVRDAATGKVAGSPEQHKEKLLVGLDGRDHVWLLNRHTGEVASHPLPNGPPRPAVPAVADSSLVSPDGRWFVSSWSRHSLRVRDTRAANGGWVELEGYRNEGLPACGRVPPACAIPLRFSSDGRYLVTWWRGFNLWYLSDREHRMVRLTTVRDQTWWCPDASFSPDGRRMAAVVDDNKEWPEAGRPGTIRVWETASGSEAFRFDPPGGATGCAFTPDGKRLVVAHPDTTFSVWDYGALESRAVRAAGDTWVRLANRDARVALGAVDALAADPNTVALLREQFRPADTKRVAQLIDEMGDEDFATREAAEKALAALGERAEKELSQATRSPSAEVRSRAGRLLVPISGAHSAARLRAVRAVEALERIGTPAARELLVEWAKESGTAVASEAEAALVRLNRR